MLVLQKVTLAREKHLIICLFPLSRNQSFIQSLKINKIKQTNLQKKKKIMFFTDTTYSVCTLTTLIYSNLDYQVPPGSNFKTLQLNTAFILYITKGISS